MVRKRTLKPTLEDVARRSGVGTMTVSRVVNNIGVVRPGTAERVRAAIRELGYEPNEAARMLKGQTSRTIALIVPDLADTFFSVCANAVQQKAAREGYLTLLMASERDRENEFQALSMVLSRNIAGVLIVPSSAQSLRKLAEIRERGVPVVMLDRTIDGLDACSVMVENERGARNAVEHLLKHGHTRILCIGYDSQFNSIRSRIDGYRRAMKEAGLPSELSMAEGASGVGGRLLKRLRSANPPTAVFSLNNVATLQVLRALQEEKIAIPRSLALVGFDDFEMAPLMKIPLTAVRQPAAELGRTGAQLLLDRIIGRRDAHWSTGQPHILLPTELRIRESCGCRIRPQSRKYA